MTAPETADWVWLARIRRPQGRKGEVFADILTDFPEKFAERTHLWLIAAGDDAARSLTAPREAELIAHWLHKGGVVLHFAGIDSISAAEALAGLIVAIPRAQRAELGEDEVHIADLIGCTLVDVASGTPVEVGRIENVDRSAGPVPLLILRGTRGEVLVPFAQPYVRSLDVAHARVEMALPEGLSTVNE
ncbi:MAG TPA: ribosome maturation factor RimM [Terracidiphilus sp.]|nr:ribosome maturation factor RimM [Terracidiphilus sp.]